MLEGSNYRPVTLPRDMVVGDELVTPVARLGNETQDESNRKAWFAALTSAYGKRSELGDEAVRINLGKIVEAALANGMNKPELADHLRAMGVGVTLKPEGPTAQPVTATPDNPNQASPSTPDKPAPVAGGAVPPIETGNKPEENGEYPSWIDDIVSTGDYQVYLHRTDLNTAQKVMGEGFHAGPDLKSTATSSGRDRQSAFADFKRVHKDLPGVVIFRIPNRVLNEVTQNRQNAIDSGNEGNVPLSPFEARPPQTVSEWLLDHYYDEQSDGIVVPKEWIYGFADQNTLNLTKNTNYDTQLRDVVK